MSESTVGSTQHGAPMHVTIVTSAQSVSARATNWDAAAVDGSGPTGQDTRSAPSSGKRPPSLVNEQIWFAPATTDSDPDATPSTTATNVLDRSNRNWARPVSTLRSMSGAPFSMTQEQYAAVGSAVGCVGFSSATVQTL